MYADLIDLVKSIREKDLDLIFHGVALKVLPTITDKILETIVSDIGVEGHLRDTVTESIVMGLEYGLESEQIIENFSRLLESAHSK